MSATILSLHPGPDAVCAAGIKAETEFSAAARQRYLDAVIRMHDAAIECRELEACADALCYGLAWIVFSLNRMDVAGDVMARYGRYLEALGAAPPAGDAD